MLKSLPTIFVGLLLLSSCQSSNDQTISTAPAGGELTPATIEAVSTRVANLSAAAAVSSLGLQITTPSTPAALGASGTCPLEERSHFVCGNPEGSVSVRPTECSGLGPDGMIDVKAELQFDNCDENDGLVDASFRIEPFPEGPPADHCTGSLPIEMTIAMSSPILVTIGGEVYEFTLSLEFTGVYNCETRMLEGDFMTLEAKLRRPGFWSVTCHGAETLSCETDSDDDGVIDSKEPEGCVLKPGGPVDLNEDGCPDVLDTTNPECTTVPPCTKDEDCSFLADPAVCPVLAEFLETGDLQNGEDYRFGFGLYCKKLEGACSAYTRPVAPFEGCPHEPVDPIKSNTCSDGLDRGECLSDGDCHPLTPCECPPGEEGCPCPAETMVGDRCIEGCCIMTSIDYDNDGIPEWIDNCSFPPNEAQDDCDGDGVGDACDFCPTDFDPTNADADQDRSGDVCDPINDSDEDGVADQVDNCLWDSNPDQTDADGDGVGDVCDPCPDDAANTCLGGPPPAKPAESIFPNGCSDTFDNDGNGLTDCADPSCLFDPSCGGGPAK